MCLFDFSVFLLHSILRVAFHFFYRPCISFLAFKLYTSACIFVFLLYCFLGCIECYYFYFYFLLSIFIIYFFFFFDMDHWSDTNK